MAESHKYHHALCLYPYYSGERGTGIDFFPPTGLEYVATALKGHVGQISLIDLRYNRSLLAPRKMSEFIQKNIDLICISIGWRAQYKKVCDYISQLPPAPTTVVGGREATDKVEDVFLRCPNVDVVVRGEGEQTIQELADGQSLDGILGLSYRHNDKIIHNPNRPLQPIEDIAPPDRTLRQNRYFPVAHGIRLLPTEFDTILGSRGCPYKCKFCTFSMNPLGQKRDYVARSPESVVDEIEASKGDMIIFSDDNFFVNPDRVERICDLIIERGIDKLYFANARIEAAKSPHMLEKAYRAGFRMLLLGIESASDRILEQLNKGFNTKQIRDAFTVFRQFPFFYHAYFIYGNIGETEEEMMAIPKFARELGVHMINLSMLRVDKFTPLRQLVESTPGYWINEKGNVYSREFDRERLRHICNQIRNRFMFRPGQLAKTLTAVHNCNILTYWQMAKLGLISPLFFLDYVVHRSRKTFSRLRSKFRH
jgi:anaerobic magnesium-protoporphyrin IX monomethyl ester cyclase